MFARRSSSARFRKTTCRIATWPTKQTGRSPKTAKIPRELTVTPSRVLHALHQRGAHDRAPTQLRRSFVLPLHLVSVVRRGQQPPFVRPA